MLKQVSIHRENGPKLYNYLAQKPRVARYIQGIWFDWYRKTDLEHLQKIIDLTAPNLKILGGQLPRSDVSAAALLKFLQASETLKLEQILFGEELTEFHLDLLYQSEEVISAHFPQFKKLTQLKIYDYYLQHDDMQNYEKLLRGLSLETLCLKIKSSSSRQCSPDAPCKTCTSRNVHQDQSLTTLRVKFVSSSFDPRLLEYLSFKYPNLKYLSMSGRWGDKQQISPVFEHVEEFHLKDWEIGNLDTVDQFVKIWKRQSNSVSIRFDKPGGAWYRMNIKKQKHVDHAYFVIDSIYNGLPLKRLVDFLSIFCESALKRLEIDLTYFDEHGTYDSTYPSDFLRVAPTVKFLKLTAKRLHLKQRLDLAHLHTVEFVNMDITTEDITFLGLSAPSLQHLVLSSCSFSEENRRNGVRGDRIINLCDNQLKSVFLNASSSSGSGVDKDQVSLIQVIIEGLEHYFFAKSSPGPLLQLSHKEHTVSYSTPSNVITIICKSLQNLKVDLGHINFDVQFDTEGNIKK
ncbi:hypothetical protein MBANPS3_002985 [Mucor bainieri]